MFVRRALTVLVGLSAFVACRPAGFASAQGFKCQTDSECGSLSCVLGVCDGARPSVWDGGAALADNAGVLPGVGLAFHPATTITEEGAMLQNCRYVGGLVIDANNVVVRNCHITGADPAVKVTAGRTGVQFVNVQFDSPTGVGLLGSPHSVVSSKFDAAVGMFGAIDTAVEGNLYAPSLASTGTFVSLTGGSRAVIAGNVCRPKGGSCVAIRAEESPANDTLILGNRFEGSGIAAVELTAGAQGVPQNIRVMRNTFAGQFESSLRGQGTLIPSDNARADGGAVAFDGNRLSLDGGIP